MLEFKVLDTGIGIPDKEIPNLFKMFRTASQQRNVYNCRGTGIGLTISKKLVESLGGSISLTSQLGIGTEVKFTIRCKNSHQNIIEQPISHDSFDALSSEFDMHTSQILDSDVKSRNSINIFYTQQ